MKSESTRRPVGRVTLQSMSEELGVSPSTISLVLLGKGTGARIAAETQNRIRRLASERGYRPNWSAKALRSRKTQTIGVVFPDIHETFMTHVLKGIEQTLYPIGYRLMISTSYFDAEIEADNVRAMMDRNVDGLIIAPYAPFCPRQASRTHIEEAIERNVPIVAVDRYLPGLLERAVVADDYGDAVRAVEQLHAAGCRSVGYVGFEINISSLQARFAGYRDATKRLGLEDGARVFLGSRNLDSGDLTNTLTQLSRSAAMPDAFLVTTNGLSYRVAEILRRLGAGGVKIAKFGEDPVWANTGMLEIRQPHEALGRTAAALLTSTMRGEAPEAKPVVVESGEYL